MTIGSWSIGHPSYDISHLYSTRTWNGADGKLEVNPDGTGIRDKWNNYSVYTRRFLCLGTIVSGRGYGLITVSNPAHLDTIAGWKPNDDLRLLAKLAEKVRGHSFDLGINLAEGKKSYKTVLGNLRSLGGALVALKRRNFSEAWSLLGVGRKRRRRLRARDVGGRWLEMQYAWKPMVSQAFEAAKAVATFTGPRVLKFHVSSGSRKGTYDGTQSDILWSYPVQVSVAKSITAELTSDLDTFVSLGLVDPLSIAWEVVPYSFVVDWFLPVGTYLSARAIVPKLVGRFATISRRGQKAGAVTFTPAGLNAQYKDVGKRESSFIFERIISSSLDIPAPKFNKWPDALSARHLTNAVALIHSALFKDNDGLIGL